MGNISTKLQKTIKKSRNRKVVELKNYAKGRQSVDDSEVRDVKELINKGYDPLHASYVSAQNLVSLFAETVSELPIFEEYSDIVGLAEDEYLPDGPPFSPLTRSYFTTWAFFDVQFGQDNETIGTCLIDVSKELKISSDMVEVIKLFQKSRMGIYVHSGKAGSKTVLKELISGEEYTCYVGSGYSGKKGELWFARMLPSYKNLFDYNVIFTTPYILTTCSKKEWLAYIDRTLPKIGTSDKEKGVDQLMKYGLEANYWNEYIFLAYHHFQHDAIFLSGIPDIKKSLPHAE
jgi:hypothetical protein